jgi:hypothetical protein
MFSKVSRYRKLLDIVTTDANGRELESKTLRLLPEVSGTFQHTIEEVDRLDHLAYKYYKQPRKWWRICDANPEFMSPQALLGKEPIVIERFPLNFDIPGVAPPWADLLKLSNEIIGIENIQILDEIEIVPEQQMHSGQWVTVHIESPKRAMMLTYNRINLNAEKLKELIDRIELIGFAVGQPERIGRVGKNIIIPTNITG